MEEKIFGKFWRVYLKMSNFKLLEIHKKCHQIKALLTLTNHSATLTSDIHGAMVPFNLQCKTLNRSPPTRSTHLIFT